MDSPARPTLTAAAVKAAALRVGFDLAGITDVSPTAHASHYRAWLGAGYHGSMEYLAREDAVTRRLDINATFPELRSAVVVALEYCNDKGPVNEDASRGIIAQYARGRDYHKVIKRMLLELLREVEALAGHALPLARASVDTAPVLERDLAQRAGLGWFGRNTMLINPRRGSYFFLGTLLLEIELEADAPFVADHCGTCNACVEACPTGALLGRDANGAPVIDATRCISYLTIENRGAIPVELRPLMGNRVFGCDICQESCPWNVRFALDGRERERERLRVRGREQIERRELPVFAARGAGEPPAGVERLPADGWHPGTDSPSLVELLDMALDEAAWEAFSRGSAMRRAGRAGFARNVCVALGNWGSADAVPVLTRALADAEPLVRAHAAWALGRVGSAAARSALSARASVETDGTVLLELSAATDA